MISSTYFSTTVARWFVFKPKNPNLGKYLRTLGRLEIVDMYILRPFGIFYAHLGYFKNIWYILCLFGSFFPVLGSMHQEIWQPCFPLPSQAAQVLNTQTGVCQMVYFQTPNLNWGIFLGSSNGRCCYILWTLGTFCANLVYFVVIWYILW
jgi:hypothetical protein